MVWSGGSGQAISARDMQQLDEALGRIKVEGCKKADPKEGFDCNWSGPELITKIDGVSGRIFKGPAGWTLVKAGD